MQAQHSTQHTHTHTSMCHPKASEPQLRRPDCSTEAADLKENQSGVAGDIRHPERRCDRRRPNDLYGAFNPIQGYNPPPPPPPSVDGNTAPQHGAPHRTACQGEPLEDRSHCTMGEACGSYGSTTAKATLFPSPRNQIVDSDSA